MSELKMSCEAIRMKNRAEYREEQHLPKVKWAAFREQRRHEDTAVARFERKQHAAAHETREVDARHDAFLRRLRRCLDRKVRESGGTEFSVLRASFLDWDADCSGAIDAGELRKVLASLGLRMDSAEAARVVKKYCAEGEAKMPYELLLSDVARCGAHFLAHPAAGAAAAVAVEETPRVGAKSALVRRFIKKLRIKLVASIKKNGEYERILIRRAFLNWDANSNGKLDPQEFMGAMTQLGVTLSEREASEIVASYCSDGSGEISYPLLVDDVCDGCPHFTEYDYELGDSFASSSSLSKSKSTQHHANRRAVSQKQAMRKSQSKATEATPEEESEDEQLMGGLFTTRPTMRETSALIEDFTTQLKLALENQMRTVGGTVPSILREAFLFWDGDASGKLDPREFRGAMGRVGLAISGESAARVVRHYDRSGEGAASGPEMSYCDLITDVSKGMPNFISHPQTGRAPVAEGGASGGVTTRALGEGLRPPVKLRAYLDLVRAAVLAHLPRATQTLARSTGGSHQSSAQQQPVTPRDLLHGACLRLDRTGRGRLDKPALAKVMREMKVGSGVDDKALEALTAWYDGDYKQLARDVFPPNNDDENHSSARSLARPRSLPALRSERDYDAMPTARARLDRIAAEKKTIEARLQQLQQLQKSAR